MTHTLDGCVLALGFVEQLTACDSSEDFAQQKFLLLLNFLQNAFVLLSTSRQIWKDLVNWTIRNILVSRIPGLTCKLRRFSIRFPLGAIQMSTFTSH